MYAPLFYARVRRAVLRELVFTHEMPIALASGRVETLQDSQIDSGVATVNATHVVSAIGDGAIASRVLEMMRKIVAFLRTDEGRALIALLVSLLL